MKKRMLTMLVLMIMIVSVLPMAASAGGYPGGGRPPQQHEHNYDSEVTTPATCEGEGVRTYTCYGRGDCDRRTYTESIDALGHDWDAEGRPTRRTCTEPSYQNYECDRRGCNATKREQVEAALGHSMDNGVVTTDPTCTAEGVKTYTCQRNCGHSTTEPVDALGHAYDDGVVTTEPTCTEKGVKTFTCANDPSHTYTEDVDPLGHATELETLPAKAATCTDSGLKEGKKCPVCKTTVVAQEVVPAHGHKWDAGTVTKAPTKYAKGEKTYYCEYDNNHMYVVDIPKLANYDGYDYVPKTGDNTMVVMSSAAVVSLLAAAAYVTGKKKSAC